MEVKDVKNDLRKIRYGRKRIAEMQGELAEMQRRLGILKGRGDDDFIRVATLKQSIEQLEKDISRKTSEFEEIESKYKAAIDTLEAIDQVLIAEVYIGGKKYSEMALLSKYSVRGIENRIKNALEKIAERVN